jgi:hypothetical protein
MIPLMFAKFLNVVESFSAFTAEAFVRITINLVLEYNGLPHHFQHLILLSGLAY